jgi:hypothetical protein
MNSKRWKQAFISLFLLIVGSVSTALFYLYPGDDWYQYAAFMVMGFVGSGYSIALTVGARVQDDEEEKEERKPLFKMPRLRGKKKELDQMEEFVL